MVLWELVLAACSLAESPLASQASLYRHETAIFELREYLQGLYLDYTVRPPGKVRLLRGASAAHVSQAQLEREWQLGPALAVGGRAFFSAVTGDSLQVWSAVGRELRLLWEREAPVNSVAVAPVLAGYGFVYISLPHLRAIDLQNPAVHEQPFSGLDLSGAALVTICSVSNRLATVRVAAGLIEIQQYELDFITLAATARELVAIDRENDDILDGACTDEFYFLQSHGVYIITDIHVDYVYLPSSAGYTVLRPIPDSSAVYAVGAESVAVLDHDKVQVLPGVLQVLSLRPQLVAVTAFRSKQSVTAQTMKNWRLSEAREVLVETVECEYQWVKGATFNLLFQKKEQVVHLYSVEVEETLAAVEGSDAPYSVEVCGGNSSTCVSISVDTVQGESHDIVLHNESREGSVIHYSMPLVNRVGSVSLDLTTFISGPNLNSTLSFPSYPGLRVLLTPGKKQMGLVSIEKFSASKPQSEFLCASTEGADSKVVLRYGTSVELLNLLEVDTALEKTACAITGKNLYVYGEAGGRTWLHQYSGSRVEKKEIGRASSALLKMASTPSSVLLLFADRLEVLSLALDAWQSIQVDPPPLGLCHDREALVVFSRSGLEFLVPIGSAYISHKAISLGASVRQCAYSRGSLLLLSGSDTVTVYHVSPAFQLTERFSMSANCDVTEVLADGLFGAYRCPGYYQILSISRPKLSSALARVPTSKNAVEARLQEDCLFEITMDESHCSVKKWSFSFFPLHYLLTVMLADGVKLPKPTELIGELSVTSNGSGRRQFEVKVSLEDSSSITAQQPSRYFPPSAIEVPSGQVLTLSPAHYFSGPSLHYSARASDPTVRVRLRQALEPLSSLYVAGELVSVCVEHSLVFAHSEKALVVSSFTCENDLCHIASKRYLPVSFILVSRLQVVFSTPDFVYLFLSGLQYNVQRDLSFYSVNVHSLQLDLLLSRKCEIHDDLHFIKASETLFHVFFYGDILLHCTLRTSAPSALRCSEALHSSLYKVVTLNSHLVSTNRWEIYALTAAHRFVTMELTDTLAVLSDTDEHLVSSDRGKTAYITGRYILVFENAVLSLYSIPSFKLLSSMQIYEFTLYPFLHPYNRFSDTEGTLMISMMTSSDENTIINVTSGHILGTVASSVFAFTSDSTAYAYYNSTLSFLHISPGLMAVAQGDSDAADIVLSAANGLSEGEVRVKVVWARPWWPAVLVFAAVCGSLWRRNRPQRNAEVEMQRVR